MNCVVSQLFGNRLQFSSERLCVIDWKDIGTDNDDTTRRLAWDTKSDISMMKLLPLYWLTEAVLVGVRV